MHLRVRQDDRCIPYRTVRVTLTSLVSFWMSMARIYFYCMLAGEGGEEAWLPDCVCGAIRLRGSAEKATTLRVLKRVVQQIPDVRFCGRGRDPRRRACKSPCLNLSPTGRRARPMQHTCAYARMMYAHYLRNRKSKAETETAREKGNIYLPSAM